MDLEVYCNVPSCWQSTGSDWFKLLTYHITADQLAQLVERRTTEREVSGSCPRPDQHSGS